MNIKERLDRQSPEDLIEFGDIVRRNLNGKFGDIFRAFINGMKTRELTYHQNNPTDRQALSADRILGRVEGYENVILGLEKMIADAEELKRPVEEEEEY